MYYTSLLVAELLRLETVLWVLLAGKRYIRTAGKSTCSWVNYPWWGRTFPAGMNARKQDWIKNRTVCGFEGFCVKWEIVTPAVMMRLLVYWVFTAVLCQYRNVDIETALCIAVPMNTCFLRDQTLYFEMCFFVNVSLYIYVLQRHWSALFVVVHSCFVWDCCTNWLFLCIVKLELLTELCFWVLEWSTKYRWLIGAWCLDAILILTNDERCSDWTRFVRQTRYRTRKIEYIKVSFDVTSTKNN